MQTAPTGASPRPWLPTIMRRARGVGVSPCALVGLRVAPQPTLEGAECFGESAPREGVV